MLFGTAGVLRIWRINVEEPLTNISCAVWRIFGLNLYICDPKEFFRDFRSTEY